MKKKVGIIGYWFATNYGGVASYYSLYRCIEKLGYQPFLVENPYLDNDPEGFDVFSRKFFLDNNCTISELLHFDELHKLNDEADIFVLGSDQVVTISSIRSFGKLFLMDFLDADKLKVAVSVSSGGDHLENADIVEMMKKCLCKFSAISVREDLTTQLFAEKFDIRPNRIIDPIFLTETNDYIDIAKNVDDDFNIPYLFAYILDPTAEKKKNIIETADRLGLVARVALDGRKNTHDNNFLKMDMPENTLPELDFPSWLYYIAHSEYIITDSYHGASMALLFNIPFVVIANHQRGFSRFQTLNNLFGIGDRMIENEDSISDRILSEKISFDKINEVIAKEKNYANKWIESALKRSRLSDPIANNDLGVVENTIEICVKESCTGCAACMNICPQDAIVMEADTYGFTYPKVDYYKCVRCGKCRNVCPKNNPMMSNRSIPRCFAVSASDSIRLESSSGGAFTVLSNFILRNNGVVCGASFDSNFSVSHKCVDKESDLSILKKSKYLQSNIGMVYRQVKEYADQGRWVLFVGVPCQVAALKNILNHEYNNVILVDFLCGGVPSAKMWLDYLQENFDVSKIEHIDFRPKERGWNSTYLMIQFKDHSRKILSLSDSTYEQGYHKNITKRNCCFDCVLCSTKRIGDLTIGDFWGINKFDKSLNDNKGLSVILSNNEYGDKYLEMCKKDFELFVETPFEAAKFNSLYEHRKKHERRDVFLKSYPSKGFNDSIKECNNEVAVNGEIQLIREEIVSLSHELELIKEQISSLENKIVNEIK